MKTSIILGFLVLLSGSVAALGLQSSPTPSQGTTTFYGTSASLQGSSFQFQPAVNELSLPQNATIDVQN